MASALLPGDPSPATLSDLSLIDSYLLARYSFFFSYFPSDIVYFIINFLYFSFQLNYLVLVIILIGLIRYCNLQAFCCEWFIIIWSLKLSILDVFLFFNFIFAFFCKFITNAVFYI